MDFKIASRSWSGAVAVFVVVLLVGGPVAGQEQEQERPGGLEGVLKDLLQEGLDNQLSGEGGRVRAMRVNEESPASVLIDVRLADVAQGAVSQLACEVYDRHFAAIPGFRAEHEPIADGNSEVQLRVTYGGDGSALSSSVRVSLVNAESGAAMSHRRTALVREWTGDGSGGAAYGKSTGAYTQPPAAPSEQAAVPAREPIVVDIVPRTVGDTPQGVVASGPSPSSPPPPASGSVSPGGRVSGSLVKATPAPASTGGKQAPALVAAGKKPSATSSTSAGRGSGGVTPARRPTPAPAAAMGTKLLGVTANIRCVSLYGKSSSATWKGRGEELKFNGKQGDERGYVRALGRRKLNDGKTHDKVLQTHPSFRAPGRIEGTFTVTIPATAQKFSAWIGFLPNANASDGVTVMVRVGRRSIARKVLRPRDGVVAFTGDIPEEYRGKETTVRLGVHSGKTTKQDWVVWIDPRII